MDVNFQGALLKKWREQNKLSQIEAGKVVGITQVFWGELERGVKQPSTEILVLLSKATGIKVDDLLGNPTNPPLHVTPEQGDESSKA